MSMEVRLLLAFLLMGVVMFLTPYFYKTPPPAKNAQKTTAAQSEPIQAPASPAAAETAAPIPPAAPGAPPTEPATVAVSLPPVVIDTALFRVTFNNQGATVRSWQLKKYKGNDSKPLDLVNPAIGSSEVPFPFSLYFAGQPPTAKVNQVYYTQTPDPDGLGIAYGYSDGHTRVRKTFRFRRDSYLCEVTSQVTVDQRPLVHAIEWRGGFGDLTVANAASKENALYFNPAENKLYEQSAKAGKEPSAATANYSFAGIEDQYFAAVFLPETEEVAISGERPPFTATTFSDTLRTPAVEKAGPLVGASVSLGADNHFRLFVGPKDLDLLKSVDPKLEQVVSFGWLSLLAKPLFLVVNWFHKSFVHNFGWAIVLVTIVINLALFPLRFTNMKSMRKMQALKPQIDAINAKYKKLSLTDPRKADQNQEVMALYKQNGVNPMGGCVPMLIQLPFFIAFYKVFTVSVEMRGASWLWVTDLSQPETLPIHILPLVMIGSQFWMQKMTPTAGAGDPNQQKMMMYMMPLIFGFMFYSLPSGLVLYYLTSNLVGMGLQSFFNQTATAEDAARSVEPPKKNKNRK